MPIPKAVVLTASILTALVVGWMLGATAAQSKPLDAEPIAATSTTLAAPPPTAATTPAPSTTTTSTTTTATTVATAPPPAPLEAPAETAPALADPMDRVIATYAEAIPAEWRDAVAPRLELIDGWTSLAYPNGTIEISIGHARGRLEHLRAVIAHEIGHLIAFAWGSQQFNGAAPEGWPGVSSNLAETWADCVSRAFTDLDDPSTGLPSCEDDMLTWTAAWLSAGPGSHARTS